MRYGVGARFDEQPELLEILPSALADLDHGRQFYGEQGWSLPGLERFVQGAGREQPLADAV